jgi:Rrf2 family protein
MAILTKKSIYGLMAIYELYRQRQKTNPIQLKEISQSTNIPKNYLEQIFVELKKANLIISTRGAKGGYKINQNRENISIKDVIIALDGHISSAKERTTSPLLNLFFDDCDKKLANLFDKPLSKLEDYEQMVANQINFSI